MVFTKITSLIKSAIIIIIIFVFCFLCITIPIELVSLSREHSKKYDKESVAYLDTVIATECYSEIKGPRVRCVFYYYDDYAVRHEYISFHDAFILPKGFPVPIRYRSDNPDKVCINHSKVVSYEDSLHVLIKRVFWSGERIIVSKQQQHQQQQQWMIVPIIGIK